VEQKSLTASLRFLTAKANETLEEVKNAEVMANMTLEAAEQAMMRAMEADEQAKNTSSRMDNLIQVWRTK